MKKWKLEEHLRDIEDWEMDRGNLFSDKMIVWFTAYERWLNDRELLTIEDSYEWKTTPVPADDPTRSPAR